jgi:dTDP-4-dehydrorhamnose reductase
VAAAAFASVTGTYFRNPPANLPGGVDSVPAPIDEIPTLIRKLRPDVVLHTAAAWRTEEEARAIIVEGTRGIADACAETGARLVHLSTDLVFDGERGPYSEDDPPTPVNFYGAAKAAAERIVARTVEDAVIVRTSLVTRFDPPDPRTEPVLAALRGEREPVTLFTDEYRCPVRTEDLAAALVELAGNGFTGILHVAGPERLSRCELGLRIAAYHRLDPAGRIRAGLSTDSGMIRPRDCALRIDLARRVLRTPLHPLANP